MLVSVIHELHVSDRTRSPKCSVKISIFQDAGEAAGSEGDWLWSQGDDECLRAGGASEPGRIKGRTDQPVVPVDDAGQEAEEERLMDGDKGQQPQVVEQQHPDCLTNCEGEGHLRVLWERQGVGSAALRLGPLSEHYWPN